MMLYEQFNIQARKLELKFPNLPSAFDGYRILHLSDLHIVKLGLLEKRLITLIENEEVDACFITGDVTAEPRASDVFRRVCSKIKTQRPPSSRFWAILSISLGWILQCLLRLCPFQN